MGSRNVKYAAGEIGRVRVVEDFLPPPAALVAREDNVKVTLSLSRQRRFLQTRGEVAARPLSAHDPRAARRLRGKAGGETLTCEGRGTRYCACCK
jgi:hypothetical protein